MESQPNQEVNVVHVSIDKVHKSNLHCNDSEISGNSRQILLYSG